MRKGSLAQRVHGVAALDHPLTCAAYQLVRDEGELTRDEAADRLDVARSVAAFHLDKLVDAGLAQVRFARRTGRTGPGAGRPAKIYRRAEADIEVSLPERHYDLAGDLLAQAIERAASHRVSVDEAVRQAARDTGRRLGEGAIAGPGPRATAARRRAALMSALESQGYEPQVRQGEIVLANCPFHALAEQHRDLVCGMNLELLSGVIEGSGGTDALTARLAPEAGYCCVRMKRHV